MSPVGLNTSSTSSASSYSATHSSTSRHSTNNNDYSIYTQMEENKLNDELREAEERLLKQDSNDHQMSERQQHFRNLRMRIKRLEDSYNCRKHSPYKNNNHEHESLIRDSMKHDMEVEKDRKRERYWHDVQHFAQFEEANRRARKRQRRSDPRNDRKGEFHENWRRSL